MTSNQQYSSTIETDIPDYIRQTTSPSSILTTNEGLIFNTFNTLHVCKLHPDAKIPTIGTDYSAGYDLYSLTDGIIPPGEKRLVKTGISIRLPTLQTPFRVYGSIRSRSGLSVKKDIEVGAGVIDQDFTGTDEIGVILRNNGTEEFQYNKHDRIAQMVLEVHITPPIVEVSSISRLDSNRQGGFGSTGT